MFRLEKYLKTAKEVSEIRGVYWCARCIDYFILGNHHFVTCVYSDEEQATRVSKAVGIEYCVETNEQGLQFFYSTGGVNTDNKKINGKIVFEFNGESDQKAIAEEARPVPGPLFRKDSNFQGHRMMPEEAAKYFEDTEALMIEAFQGILNFNAHYEAGRQVLYDLDDENCACMMNTLFKSLGFPEKLRKQRGEFWGVDWGEEDEVPVWYFMPEEK